ncbi:MAG: aminotransferase class III-fold pyridoxal phosphate-dependent enzyme, partial [Proteobacteria bacterium]|nr:aminotransferase class III-fold pyridoxal phosphate-dependent enzyme [Pseudomonadota bacterium]
MFLKPRQSKKSARGARRAPRLRRTAAGRPPPKKAKRGAKPGRRGVWLKRLVVWGGSAAVWTLVLLGGLVAWYAYDLPEIDEIAAAARQPSVTLLAADGTLLASYGEVHGARVSVAELPPHLPLAVLAVEDRRFYRHGGVDFRGLLRASLANLRAGRIVQGGSTITQQLAKNLFLTPERTLKRKIQELLLALWLERKFTKDQILALYLNRVYLGAGTFGVDAAARRYFDKPAAEVNLYEAALLAGLLKAPSRYNPARHQDRAARRTSQVLAAMTDAGFITADQAAQARREKTRGRAAAGAQARYFTDWVLAQVSAYVGPADRDLTVITTLDPAYQRIAEAELVALLDGEGRERRVGQGALVLMDPDGAVRAMVGGRSYDASQFNRATQALRQPGSAFKPFVYLAALENGFTPSSLILDGPFVIDQGLGVVVDDPDGNRFLDLNAGIAVCSTGHRHPHVVEAIHRQVDRYLHMSGTDFYYEEEVAVAERLAAVAPMSGPCRVAFGNSGAEAVEAAFKLARHHTGRPHVIAFYGAFHGRTLGALSLTASKPVQRRGFLPLVPEVTHVQYPFCYRCDRRDQVSAGADCCGRSLEQIEEVLLRRRVSPTEVAAIFVEPVQGEGGYVVPPPSFLQGLRRICDTHGILLIFDEVITAFGRLGKPFAADYFGVL